jgi:glycosyltransferase involved in cell wall biosynthesis
MVVGHLGRFHAAKNHHFFLRVAEVLARREQDFWFLFVGDGPLRNEIERLAEQLQLRQRCVFVASTSGSSIDGFDVSIPEALAGAMDVLLFPSLWEGLPVSLTEAQAAGLPVVASSLITPEVAAVPGLVRFLDLRHGPELWADEVQKALSRPRWSSEQARDCLALTDFDIHRSAREMLALYAAV